MTDKLRLRGAGAADARLLFDWVNRPESLATKLKTTGPIAWEVHQAWLAERLADPGSGLWIAELAGAPVGQARVERRGEALEVDIFVVPAARGRSLGRRILALLREECARRWPGLPLVARVRPHNLASVRLFAAAGYREKEVRDDHLVFVLEPA